MLAWTVYITFLGVLVLMLLPKILKPKALSLSKLPKRLLRPKQLKSPPKTASRARRKKPEPEDPQAENGRG